LISRRSLLRAMLGALLVPLVGISIAALPSRRVVRPPGAIEEERFLEICVRCGACIEACFRDGRGTLEPCGLPDGLPLIGTPKVNPLRAPCEALYGKCENNLPCIRSCPTGALKWVEPDEIKLGSVKWSPRLCIAFLGGTCLICAEVCPVPGAITPEGRIPIFHPDRCVGCGRCVYACPADPKALVLVPDEEVRYRWRRGSSK